MIVEPQPIIVLFGQSNSDNPDLVQEVEEYADGAGAIFVHVSADGSGLGPASTPATGNWSPSNVDDTGSPYGELVDELDAILDPSSASYVPGAYLASAIFVQGEADTNGSYAARNYGENLLDLHTDMVERFGDHELIVSALSDNADISPAREENWELVQEGQLYAESVSSSITVVDPDQVAAQNGLDPDEMFQDDGIHYDQASGMAENLGQALGKAAIKESRLPFEDKPSGDDDHESPVENKPDDHESTNESDSASCFVATAAFGSGTAPEVRFLRRFRDEYLAGRLLGRAFIKLYWFLGPKLAKFVRTEGPSGAGARCIIVWIVHVVKLTWKPTVETPKLIRRCPEQVHVAQPKV